MMSADLVLPALRELPILLVLGWGGAGLLIVVGMRRPLLVAGSAPIAFTAIALAVFPIAVIFSYAPLVPVVVLSLVLGLLALLRKRTRYFFLPAFLVASGISVLGWMLRWLVVIPERVGEDAILVMLQSVLDIQGGDLPNDPRRGLAYPLIIGLSDSGSILSSLTPVISVSIVALIIHFGRELLGPTEPKYKALILSTSVAVLISTPIFWVAMAYTNSHTLLGLSITAVAGSVLTSLGRTSMTREAHALLIFGLFVSATVRFEGALLSLVAILPALLSPSSFTMTNSRSTLLGLVPLSGFAYWTVFLPSDVLFIETVAIGSLLALAPILIHPLMTLLGSAGEKYAHKAVWTILLVTPVLLMVAQWPSWVPRVLAVLSLNLLGGVGGWGGLISATLLLSAFTAFRGNDRVLNVVFRVFFWGALSTLTLKLLDSPPGALGFNDSVVRSMLHWVGPLAFTWILALKALISDRGKIRPSRPPSPRYETLFKRTLATVLNPRNRFTG